MFLHDVSLKLALHYVGFVAVRTLIRLLVAVCMFMRIQDMFLVIRFATYVAFERFGTVVCVHVALQVLPVGERLFAHLTFVGSLPGVQHCMLPQIALQCRRQVAMVAFVGFDTVVD